MMDEGFVDYNKWASVSAIDLPFVSSLERGAEDDSMDISNPRFDAEESPAPRSPTGPRMPQAHKLPYCAAVSKTPPTTFSQNSGVFGSFPALILPGRATTSVVSPSRHISRSRQRRRSNSGSGSYVYPPPSNMIAVDDGGLSAPYTTGNSPPPQSPSSTTSSTVTLSPVGSMSFSGSSNSSSASSSTRRNSRQMQANIRRSASAERRGRDDYDSPSPIPVKSPRSKSPSVLIPHSIGPTDWSSEHNQALSVPTSPVSSRLFNPTTVDFSSGNKTKSKRDLSTPGRSVRRSQSMRQIASVTPPSIPIPAPPTVTPMLPPQAAQAQAQTNSNMPYISLVRQPPKQTVYMRILKPYPTVALTLPQDSAMMKSQQLFVEASLIRSDNGEDITACLEGTRVVQVVNMFAIFKKLKITSTSQQKNTSFCLRFSLRRYTSTECQLLSECLVTSTPIVVFSHTGYLSQSASSESASKPLRSPSPRVQERHVGPIADTLFVTEVIPSVAQAGARVVIIGSNFKPSPHLCVSFNEMIVKPEFHDDCALVCNVPPIYVRNVDSLGRIKVDVRVSLDGNRFSKSVAVMHICGPFVAPMSPQQSMELESAQ